MWNIFSAKLREFLARWNETHVIKIDDPPKIDHRQTYDPSCNQTWTCRTGTGGSCPANCTTSRHGGCSTNCDGACTAGCTGSCYSGCNTYCQVHCQGSDVTSPPNPCGL